MDNNEVNRAVAKALGYEVVPYENSMTHTFVPGVKHLYLMEGRLWHSPMDCIDEYAGDEPWSPATDPADALAALEAWCKKVNDCMEIGYSPSSFMGQWSCTTDEDPIVHHANSFCEAACAAILAAEAAHG